jgi:D-glycero-D-manno-heptose 1,7-bisphosphate phosphatase
MAGKQAIFFDRDGTIIFDAHYPKYPEQVRLFPGVGESLSACKKQGMLLVLVSNQSGIGRGLITPEQADTVHDTVLNCLAQFGISLDGVYYCPHAPEEVCACRKPSPEMILRAAVELNIDLSRSYMIGDKESDIEAGKRAGCRTILLKQPGKSNSCGTMAGYAAGNWHEIAEYVLLDVAKES